MRPDVRKARLEVEGRQALACFSDQSVRFFVTNDLGLKSAGTMEVEKLAEFFKKMLNL